MDTSLLYAYKLIVCILNTISDIDERKHAAVLRKKLTKKMSAVAGLTIKLNDNVLRDDFFFTL